MLHTKPFEFPDESAATGYSGFDMELVDAISDKLNLKLVVKDINYDRLQSGAALSAGRNATWWQVP
jgi:polar amino acid transport system substrate-binding protein